MDKFSKARRIITGWWRKTRFKVIVWAIRRYHPEGVSYDPDRRIYSWRWTKELDDCLCREHERRTPKS